MRKLVTGGSPQWPHRNLIFTSLNELVAIVQEEAAHIDSPSGLRRGASRSGMVAESSRVAKVVDHYAPMPGSVDNPTQRQCLETAAENQAAFVHRTVQQSLTHCGLFGSC